MRITYRKAVKTDLPFLAESRLAFLHLTSADERYPLMKQNLLQYFSKALSNTSCEAIFALDEEKVIGMGIVFYYDSVPSLYNLTGRNAYITSMYVDEAYRRQGIASKVLKKLLHCAVKQGIRTFFLSTTQMGRPLYEKFGFVDSHNAMTLKLS